MMSRGPPENENLGDRDREDKKKNKSKLREGKGLLSGEIPVHTRLGGFIRECQECKKREGNLENLE